MGWVATTAKGEFTGELAMIRSMMFDLDGVVVQSEKLLMEKYGVREPWQALTEMRTAIMYDGWVKPDGSWDVLEESARAPAGMAQRYFD